MKRTLRAIKPKYENGAVAIETAIVLPIILLCLALPSIALAFFFRQYSAAHKTAHDVAIYLSTAPRLEFTTAGPDGRFAAMTVANTIIAKELAAIVPDGVSIDTLITCRYWQGGSAKPNLCTPQIFKNENAPLYQFDIAINLAFVNPLTGTEIESMYISTVPSVRYLGN